MMSSKWREIKLKNNCTAIFSGGTPQTTKPTYWGGGVNWLSSGETRNHYIRTTEKTITQLGVKNSSTRKAQIGDIVLASAGQGKTRGQVSYCLINTYINQSIIAIRTNREIIEPLFLLYNLFSRYEELRSISDASSTRGSLTCKLIEDLQIKIPPIPTQRKIVAVLSAYDDLIENNLRRIKILEEMAQNLYREWFVKSRFPGHEQAHYVDSPLGRIPEEWEVKPLNQVCEVIDCLHSKKPKEETVPEQQFGFLLHIWNLPGKGKLDLRKKYFLNETDYHMWIRNIEVIEGDCVITNVGRVGDFAQIPRGVKAAIGRNMTAVRPIKEGITPTFLIEYLRSPYMEREKEAKVDRGTIMDSLNVKGIVTLLVPLPREQLLQAFEHIAFPIRLQSQVIQEENDNLQKTRDILLPKLILGEVDVSDMDISDTLEVIQ